MERIVIDAKAKLNLSLDVLRRREDNYHDMLMVMQDVDLYDTISVEKTDTGKIKLSTSIEFLPTDERNLAVRAAVAFYKFSGIEPQGVDIKIHKRIPVAAGLAGGSTDAAGVLKALNALYETNISKEELCRIGKTLGADVPYCIVGGTALAEGIGEILTPLPELPDCTFIIAHPDVAVSTKFVFGKLDLSRVKYRPDTAGMKEALKKGDLGGVARRMLNVFEPITSSNHKIIRELESIMLDCGAMGAAMSGSGPSVFSIFDNEKKAEECAAELKKLVNDVFIVPHKKKRP
ncbi:MAG: 4-(cytidine 5'-diphospho)-2-C-methyl-D-erythritol kinase [Clostridia bacterium]|nr:4-(cytidine 5'-diphospho)-2-C-methyl-D-erythritol kinase [Clostridia bacterium]